MIVCVAVVSADVVSVACPLASSATAAPRLVAPSVNATVPVVTGVAPLVTVAVNVTLSPKIDGFSDDVSAVDVGARWTTCVSAVLVLSWKAGVPL